jgi:hypothetical protein
MPKEFQSLVYILHFLRGVEMTDWMNLLCWYIFIIMLCDLVTNAKPYTVSSLIYKYVILVNKIIFSEEWNEGEKNIDNIIIDIVENIKFIYTSFDRVFLTCFAASGNELYIFRQCTYIVSIAPKKLSNCLKRAETSLVLIIFDCVLCEVRAYKFISL